MPLLRSKEINLSDGRMLSLRTHRCPIAEVDLCKALLGHLHWTFGGEDFSLTEALQGRYESTACNRVYTAFMDRELVGTTWSITGTGYPGVGLLAEVSTSPNHRRMGIARRLCMEAIHDFTEDGGYWLFLATASDQARALYSQLGFKTYAGNVMSCTTPGKSEAEYWARGGQATVRPAVWGDLPRLVCLYTAPLPWAISNWGWQVFSSRYCHQTYGVSSAGPLWKLVVDAGGCWLVAETRNHALVGSVTITPGRSSPTHHTGVLDVVVHGNHLKQAPQLVASALSQAKGLRIAQIYAFVESGNQEKSAVLSTAGFECVSSLPSALNLGTRTEDVVIFSRPEESYPSL